jgi:thiamine pyrophosphate-dependent acetolactate synthase large subunit-like protein
VANTQKLDRRDAVRRIVRDRASTLIVASLGAPSYDLAAAGDHERNFYLWGAMGGAAMVGLGLALAQRETPVIVLTGDGEALMGLGGFATMSSMAKPARSGAIPRGRRIWPPLRKPAALPMPARSSETASCRI